MTYDDAILLRQLKRERDPGLGAPQPSMRYAPDWFRTPQDPIPEITEFRLNQIRDRLLGIAD